MATSKIPCIYDEIDVGTYTVSLLGVLKDGVLRLPYNFINKNRTHSVAVNSVTVAGVGEVDKSKINASSTNGNVIFYSSDATIRTYNDRIFQINITVS